MTRRNPAQAIAEAAAGLVADGPADVAGQLAFLLTDLVEVIGGGSIAGLMIRDDLGRFDVLAASSHQAAQLELFQIQHADGPCIEAWLENRAVHASTAPEIRERWQKATEDLAAINPDVLRRVAEQIRLTEQDPDQNAQVAVKIERMLQA